MEAHPAYGPFIFRVCFLPLNILKNRTFPKISGIFPILHDFSNLPSVALRFYLQILFTVWNRICLDLEVWNCLLDFSFPLIYCGLLCPTLRIQNLFSLCWVFGNLDFLSPVNFTSSPWTCHFLVFLLSFFIFLPLFSPPPLSLSFPPSCPPYFFFSHPILSLWTELFMERTPFLLCLWWNLSCFLHFPLAEDLAFLKNLHFLCCSWVCVYFLLWTYPLKNMCSWETFCGTTLAQEFTYPFPFPWNCSLLHHLRICVIFSFLAIMDSQMGHGHVLPGSL